jgi:hypothetical protein
MPRSEPPMENDGPDGESIIPIDSPKAGIITGHVTPPALIDSWDPADDETAAEQHRPAQWDWHGYPSWGRRAVAAYPVLALMLAIALIVGATISAQGAIAQVQSITGTGGATLLSGVPLASQNRDTPETGVPADYHDVTFQVPGAAVRTIEGSTSLALPNYPGWVANGSAGAANSLATVSGGLLHVGVRHPTSDFRGWFLTATSATPESCAFQFSAASPPPLRTSDPQAVGELVMAVQTSQTIVTGDINYVLVAENVYPDGRRELIVGYSLGHLSNAVEHVLRQEPWTAGPLHVAVQTNGNTRLEVWVNGRSFYSADDLDMGITPPFEPYLEVQARRTAYTVAFDGYSSVCQNDVDISDVPDGSIVRLGALTATAHGGSAVVPMAMVTAPITGDLSLSLPGETVPVRFSRHRYWPGDRFSYEPGA